MNTKKIVNFIFELSQLKKQKHTGWWMAGVKDPVTVAEHQFRAAQIGYILATMEGADAEKVACMLIIHDNVESRVGDQNKVMARYINGKKEAEKRAFDEQIEGLGEQIEERWKKYFDEFEERNTKEGIIAKDADWLEVAFQGKEYLDLGHKSAQDWIDNVEKAVETESAKKIIKEMKETEFSDWWQGLKKMTYQKIS